MPISKQERVLKKAKEMIVMDYWSPNVERISDDGIIIYKKGWPKCNLFVYEMLKAWGVEIELNQDNIFWKIYNIYRDETPKAKTCQDWYNGDAEGMKHIGDGINGLNKS